MRRIAGLVSLLLAVAIAIMIARGDSFLYVQPTPIVVTLVVLGLVLVRQTR